MQNDRLRAKLLEYHQRRNYHRLQEQLNRALGDAASQVQIQVRVPTPHATEQQPDPSMTVYPEHSSQMYELTEFALRALSADLWRIHIDEWHPHFFLRTEVLIGHLDALLKEFERLLVYRPEAHTFDLILDRCDYSPILRGGAILNKDSDNADYQITLRGNRLVRQGCDFCARILLRDYGWDITASASPFGRAATLMAGLRKGLCTTQVSLLYVEDTGLITKYLSGIVDLLKYRLKREVAWEYNRLIDRPTKQWLRASFHSTHDTGGSIWRVESVGKDFLVACGDAFGEIMYDSREIIRIIS